MQCTYLIKEQKMLEFGATTDNANNDANNDTNNDADNDNVSNNDIAPKVNGETEISIFNDVEKDKIFLSALNGNEHDLAKLLYLFSKENFYYSKSSNWCHWTGYKWERDDAYELRMIYADKIRPLLRNAFNMYKRLNAPPKQLIKIDKTIRKITPSNFKAKILTKLQPIFETNIGKVIEFDKNPYLIGFENGVYDLKDMVFRESRYDDFVSITVGYDYSDSIQEDIKQDLNNFLEGIMPDPDDRHYMLKLLASCLVGINSSELFHIFTGDGSNGKSKLIDLLNQTLGCYRGSIHPSFMSSPHVSDKVSPYLMELKEKRMVVCYGLDANAKLNVPLIKSFSSNGNILSRKNGKLESFKIGFKMILLCNNIPKMNLVDKDIWLRCRCLKFPIAFVDNPVLPHERKIDINISQRIPSWRLAFFHLLVEKLKDFYSENLKATPNMQETLDQYKYDTDIFLQWLTDRTEASNTDIHICDLYKDFKKWYINYYTNNAPPLEYFIEGIIHYKGIKKNITINGVTKQGIKNLKLA